MRRPQKYMRSTYGPQIGYMRRDTPPTQGYTPLRRVHPRHASYAGYHADTQDQMIRATVTNNEEINNLPLWKQF